MRPQRDKIPTNSTQPTMAINATSKVGHCSEIVRMGPSFANTAGEIGAVEDMEARSLPSFPRRVPG